MGTDVTLDPRGLDAVATSLRVRQELTAVAERVADNVRSQNITVGDREGGPRQYPLPVVVHVNESKDMKIDRIVARISLAHAAGSAVQAKHGALTKAAAQAGLKVEGRS